MYSVLKFNEIPSSSQKKEHHSSRGKILRFNLIQSSTESCLKLGSAQIQDPKQCSVKCLIKSNQSIFHAFRDNMSSHIGGQANRISRN
jgi:hypothetical protein